MTIPSEALFADLELVLAGTPCKVIAIERGITAGTLSTRLRKALDLKGLVGVPLRQAKALLGPRSVPAGITPRQRRAMELRADGLTHAEIAREMGITLRTASNHIWAALGRSGEPRQ